MAIKVVFISTAGTGTYTIPADYVSLVSVEGIGGGGNGNVTTTGAGGGGGGAYAKSVNITGLVASGTAYYQVGAAVTDTWFNAASNAVPTLTTQGILAKAGATSTTGGGGGGGSSATSVGTTRFSGGSGGASTSKSNGGGGGAGGAGGNGGTGGTSTGPANTSGGGGGSGATLIAAGFIGQAAQTTAGGNGGAWTGQTAGSGATSTLSANNTAPANGGGGGGGFNTASRYTGGAGSAGTYWTATAGGTAGSGGGGGGSGGATSAVAGGAGGLYGAGGGGGISSIAAAAGARGIIVFTYEITPVTRYWVGGSGTWDATSTTNWSATSGGAAGASVPNLGDTVIFNGESGAGTVTLSGILGCSSITTTGSSFTFSGSGTLGVNGSGITLSATTVWSATGLITIISPSATLSTNSVSMSCSMTYDRPAGTLTLGSNSTITGTFTLTQGTLDLSTFTLSTGLFSSSNTNTRAIQFGTGNITCTGSLWDTGTATNLTYTGTPTVNITTGGSVLVSASSTGAASTNLFNFNRSAGTGFVLGSSSHIRNLNFTGYTGTWGPSINSYSFYGDLTLVTGMTFTTGTGIFNFVATSGTQVITGGGQTLGPITQNGVGGTVQFAAGTTALATTATYTLTNGTLDLGTNTATLSTGLFSSSNSNVRSIIFGTGNITTTGSGVAWNASGAALTYTGTPTVNISNNSATATTVNAHTGGGSEANVFNFNFTVGSYVLTMGVGSNFGNFVFSGGTISWNLGNPTNTTFYKDITLLAGMTVTANAVPIFFSGTGTQVITLAGKTLGSITQNGVGGTVRFAAGTSTLGTTNTYTLTNGTLDLGTNTATLSTGRFSSSNTNARSIIFGTGNITITANTSSIWATSTATNLTYTGTPTVNITNGASTANGIAAGNSSGGAETNAFDFNFTGGAGTVNIATGSFMRSINFTGKPGGPVSAASLSIYGNVTLVAALGTITVGFIFRATSGTQLLNTAGKTILSACTQDGVGGTVALGDNFVLNNTYTLTNGTFNANNQNFTAANFASSNSNTRTLTMGSGTWTLSGTGAVWDLATTTGFTLNKDTANIVLSDTTTTARTFAGGGLTYNNLTIGGATGISTLTFTGDNTFATLASTKTVAHTITFPASGTTTVANWTITGTVGNVVTLNSSTAATQSTLTKTGGGVISGIDYLSIQDSNATPGSTWYAGANSTNVSNNTGWTFGAYIPSTGNMFLMF
jgi:hypothetical protein